jgi:hypothetical protein
MNNINLSVRGAFFVMLLYLVIPDILSQQPTQEVRSSFDSGYHGIWMYHYAIPDQFTRIEQALTLFDRFNIDYNEYHAIVRIDDLCGSSRHRDTTGFLIRISSRDYEKAKKLGWIYREDMASYNNYPPLYPPQSKPY